MRNSVDFIDVEIYTEKINDMYARISEFIFTHPNNRMISQLKAQQQTLANGHHRSRFFRDAQHFAEWDVLLRQSEDLIAEATIENIF